MKRFWITVALVPVLLAFLLVSSPQVSGGIEGKENSETGDTKLWQSNSPLAWSDFLAQSPNSPFDAQTTWIWQNESRYVIQCAPMADGHWQCSASVDHAEVGTLFLKKISWAKPAARASAELLAHEQGHFALGEIYARRLRDALLALEASALHPSRLTAEKQALEELETLGNTTVQHWADQAQQENERYETETKHGTLRSKQLLWESKIRGWLSAE